MPGVYVYDFGDVDLDTTGRVGDLQPVECYFDEEKNGDSVLTLRLIYDELNKWAAVKVGSYIKAMVPVRVPPKISSNTYDREVMTYKVKSAIDGETTIWESYGTPRISDNNTKVKSLFYAVAYEEVGAPRSKPVKVKRRIRAGKEVQVLELKDDGTCRVYAPGIGKGWTFLENLEPVVASTIPATFDGVEAVVTPSRLEYQLFQVTSIEQTLDHVDITAQHVFYELLHTFTNYKTQLPVEAYEAINGVFGGMVVKDERFTCLTDTANKAGALDYERKNMVQALLDPEEGICAQYGLSLVRDNYDTYLLKNVGSDRGFVVEYSKNMLDVDRVEDITDVVTRIIPMGRTKKGDPVYLDGTIWVDSPRIGDYSFPRTMYLDCSDTATESDTMSLAQVKENLLERAQAEFDAGCDVPALEMTVDFISLGDTEEHRQYRGLDKVYLFDKITVRDRVRGYDYNAEVVKIRHNVLTGLLESVSLGSIQKGTGKRKIATWQVPEVDGSNIRLQSIAPGVLAGGAVGEENLQNGAVSTRVIEAYAITTEKLAAGSVTAEKLAAGAISADFIEAGSITTDKLAAGAVTADKLAAGAISADFIEAGSITADKMAAGTITAESGILADGVVGTAQIADGSITSAKIVELNADVITSGTLSTERLLIKGTDGIIYEINAQSSGLTAAELTDEQYKNRLNGTVIVAESITAAQLAAESVTANKILAGAVTTDKLSASAVTADKIAAGAITTQKVSSDFGQSLDLSSNNSINAIVQGLTQTYVQFKQPTGTLNVGDVWVRTQASKPWDTLKVSTWDAVKGKAWGEWGYTEKPKTYVWNGAGWELLVDYAVVQENYTSITQTQKAISMKADQTTVNTLSGMVSQHSTEIKQTAEEIALKANKGDPASGVETSTVSVSADGVRIKTGGTFTVDSGNFDVSENGTLNAYGATLENANVYGTILSGGSPVLTSNDIHIGTNAPGNPHTSMVWIKPDTSTSAQTSFSAPVPWRLHENMASSQGNYRSGVLSGTAVASVGTTYTYKASVPVYIGSYSAQPTGAYVHFEVLSGANGSVLLHAERAVTITEYGSGDKIIEFNFSGANWVGNNTEVHYRIYTTPLDNHREYNVMTSSNAGLKISLVCISSSSAGAQGWRQCEVYYYA